MNFMLGSLFRSWSKGI